MYIYESTANKKSLYFHYIKAKNAKVQHAKLINKKEENNKIMQRSEEKSLGVK